MHAQITTETKADGNYTSEMTVVTVEPGGLKGKDDRKIRMLLVRSRAHTIFAPQLTLSSLRSSLSSHAATGSLT